VSVHVASWAWKQDVGDAGAKLLLVKLADSANDDGVCWPSQRTLARDCGCSDRAVRQQLARLAALGLVRIDERRRANGSKQTSLYHLSIHRNAASGRQAEPAFRGHRNGASGLEPSVEPSELPLSVEGNGAKAPRARARPAEVDRRKVSRGERQLAEAVLVAFSDVSGTRCFADDYFRGVVMRIREHPELDLDGHREVIERAFRNPWWKDGATPAVVYGRAPIFDRTLASRGGGDDLSYLDG
jgi:hypothetical protein